MIPEIWPKHARKKKKKQPESLDPSFYRSRGTAISYMYVLVVFVARNAQISCHQRYIYFVAHFTKISYASHIDRAHTTVI